MYYKTTITAGKTIEVIKHYTKTGLRKAEQGADVESDLNKFRRKNFKTVVRKVTRLINCNFNENDYFTTLTYKRDNKPSVAEDIEIFKKFIRKLRTAYRKHNAELKYITVTEVGKKGNNPHHHIIVNGIEGVNVPKLIAEIWKYNLPKITPLSKQGNYRKLAEYMLKEKEQEVLNDKHNEDIKQFYSISRNLKKPIKKTKIVKANEWKAEPTAPKGFYIDKEIDPPFNCIVCGHNIQKYTLIKIE